MGRPILTQPVTKFVDPDDENASLYVVEDPVGFMVVRETEEDDEQVSAIFESRLKAEHFLWFMLKRT